MRTVIYLSFAIQTPRLEDLLGILSTSRRNNAAAGMSGVLLLAGDAFLQLLQGPPEAVERLLRVLHRDPRHRQLTMLLDQIEPAGTAPLFEDWKMGFHHLTAVETIAGEGLIPNRSDELAAGVDRQPWHPAAVILKSFVAANRPALELTGTRGG
jgi:hypothetical protein